MTKYDPDRRSSSGAYPADEWTSRSDIGKEFGGIVLTEDLYLSIEQAYLEAALAFLSEAGVTELSIVGLETRGQRRNAPRNGTVVAAADVPEILRSLLREEFWCRLESSNGFIHVGYDYYMYIGTPSECIAASAFARGNGLFVESFQSPYASSAA